ncbi:hypothetical protein ACFFV8_00435 [Sphingobium indicum]|uniref:hypothetical protein n=1 Tax=Sphingobium indicum TaxID=332055 RepID=UPI0035EBE90B
MFNLCSSTWPKSQLRADWAYWGQKKLAFLFLASAVAMSGMPPLSGFIGKLLILRATLVSPHVAAIWAIVLGTSLMALIGLARAGSTLFWKEDLTRSLAADLPAPSRMEALPAFFLLVLLASLTLGSGPATAYMEATSAQIFDAPTYVHSVLGAGEGGPSTK